MRLAALSLTLLAGCASAPAPKASMSAAAPRALALEGVVVRGEPDPLTGLSTYDPPLLFHLAEEERRNERLANAAVLYERLLGEFPDSSYVAAARFNLGLAYEGQGAFARAAEAYHAIAAPEPPDDAAARKLWLDAHYRLSVARGRSGDYWGAVVVFERLLALDWLSDFDRLQALVGRGIALRHAGDPGGAEVALAKAMRFFDEANARAPLPDVGLVSEAAFYAGDVAAEQFGAVSLELPIELLRERLERKCELLLSAQHRFLRAMRHGDNGMIAAAGFRIGSLYEALYDAIVGLEVPAELDSEQAELYRDEVRARVDVLVEKAIMIYERSLLVGRSSPRAAEWLSRLEQALARLKTLYLEERTPS